MSCSSCKYLKESTKKVGAVSGAIYYCSKAEKYVNACNNGCSDFSNDYGRKTYNCNKIYEEGEHYYNDSTQNEFYLLILIIMIILGLILGLFN